ncbi:MarC family protein [Propionicimonas sp.]|uniref:MarC family protein n=1 Tax=Propionicimonas sp. TaxID=1955623 RepID=UPI0017FBFF72|nr:MarC family protein [Propionicimonas sp.]MBU3976954.1 MarC family protein [Actinomycetota bacterium]MBA3020525.1 MarC family protein [Propionicimonas sp.]MBU3986699.1 MarC family protein [Actinomycetota bacterium]MBU4007149.1 MarC family protein [Actinomycetota bacterium]MBU4064902.1 MarC family protein [Actinomycetota bacterium]
MGFSLDLFLTTAVTLFVIVDPPGLLPVFLALTSKLEPRQRKRAATRASAVAFGVIAIFALFGRQILDYLQVSVPAMSVSGGLLLLLVALELLMGKTEDPTLHDGVNVAIVPLGTPLMAGPGAIVATMLAVQRQPDLAGYATVAAALIVVMALVWVFLRYADLIRAVLRESGTVLASRIAGLLLSAIAVQMVADGIFGFIAAH